MTLLIVGLLLWFGGNLLVKWAGPMPHICRTCARKYYRDDACPFCGAPALGILT